MILVVDLNKVIDYKNNIDNYASNDLINQWWPPLTCYVSFLSSLSYLDEGKSCFLISGSNSSKHRSSLFLRVLGHTILLLVVVKIIPPHSPPSSSVKKSFSLIIILVLYSVLVSLSIISAYSYSHSPAIFRNKSRSSLLHFITISSSIILIIPYNHNI